MPLPLRTLALLALAALSLSLAAQQPVLSPSFDCARAASPREHTICASPALARQDSQVTAAYTALLSRLSPASAELIRSDQRQWLHWLDQVCPAGNPTRPTRTPISECLRSEYATRLAQLKPIPDFPLLYTRSEFAYTPASAAQKADNGLDSPGFGTGNFSWPQFDTPTPQQAAWNQAIYTAAVKDANDNSTRTPLTFAASVDPEGTIDLTVSILAANTSLILAQITNSTYGYGAAHPNTGVLFFNWLPSASRELKTDDIFRAGSNWQAAVPPLLAAKLRQSGISDSFTTKENFRKAVATELASPRAWQPTPTGLTISFGQYEIASYAEGMPEAELAWSTLKPWLNPAFNPALLPIVPPGKR